MRARISPHLSSPQKVSRLPPLYCSGTGVEIVKFYTAQGQVNGHHVLVLRKFHLSDVKD